MYTVGKLDPETLGKLDIARMLIERGTNVNLQDSNKSTPLHSASFHGHQTIAELLIKNGALVNTQVRLPTQRSGRK